MLYAVFKKLKKTKFRRTVSLADPERSLGDDRQRFDFLESNF